MRRPLHPGNVGLFPPWAAQSGSTENSPYRSAAGGPRPSAARVWRKGAMRQVVKKLDFLVVFHEKKMLILRTVQLK